MTSSGTMKSVLVSQEIGAYVFNGARTHSSLRDLMNRAIASFGEGRMETSSLREAKRESQAWPIFTSFFSSLREMAG